MIKLSSRGCHRTLPLRVRKKHNKRKKPKVRLKYPSGCHLQPSEKAVFQPCLKLRKLFVDMYCFLDEKELRVDCVVQVNLTILSPEG